MLIFGARSGTPLLRSLANAARGGRGYLRAGVRMGRSNVAVFASRAAQRCEVGCENGGKFSHAGRILVSYFARGWMSLLRLLASEGAAICECKRCQFPSAL